MAPASKSKEVVKSASDQNNVITALTKDVIKV